MSQPQPTPDKEYFAAIFLLAGITVTKWYELANNYWPDAYVDLRAAHPWQLAMTRYGPIRIGWRKRVISIDWPDTQARLLVTDHDVTKDETLVHAYNYADAVAYMRKLADELRRLESASAAVQSELVTANAM